MPALVVLEHLQGSSPGVAALVSSVRFRSDDNDSRDQLAPVTSPQAVSTTAAARIYPSSGSQIVDVVSSAFFLPGDFAVVEPGLPVQEVISISATPEAEYITAIFMNPHPFGSKIVKVAASFSKVFQIRIAGPPDISIANLRLKRHGSLPVGVYDQYRVPGSYTQAAGTPWASDGSVSYPPTLPDQPVQVAPGPWDSIAVMAMVEIQWLYTSVAGVYTEVHYEFIWDEAGYVQNPQWGISA